MRYDTDAVTFYRLFRNALILMPNLKSLKILSNVVRNNHVFRKLLGEICENPLPTSPYLKCLKTFNLPAALSGYLLVVNEIPDVTICTFDGTPQYLRLPE